VTRQGFCLTSQVQNADVLRLIRILRPRECRRPLIRTGADGDGTLSAIHRRSDLSFYSTKYIGATNSDTFMTLIYNHRRACAGQYRTDFPHPLDADNCLRLPTMPLPACWR
jgi:hypothetical protein